MLDSIDRSLWSGRLLSVLRIITGLIFFTHSLVKLFGFPAGAAPGHVALGSIFGAAALIEFVGSPLIILGLFTRPVAFLLSGEMAIAYFWVHAPKNFFPALNGGEEAILFCFIFLFMAFAGGGSWSLDAMRKRA
jgi:putative oxidoreductase